MITVQFRTPQNLEKRCHIQPRVQGGDGVSLEGGWARVENGGVGVQGGGVMVARGDDGGAAGGAGGDGGACMCACVHSCMPFKVGSELRAQGSGPRTGAWGLGHRGRGSRQGLGPGACGPGPGPRGSGELLVRKAMKYHVCFVGSARQSQKRRTRKSFVRGTSPDARRFRKSDAIFDRACRAAAGWGWKATG